MVLPDRRVAILSAVKASQLISDGAGMMRAGQVSGQFVPGQESAFCPHLLLHHIGRLLMLQMLVGEQPLLCLGWFAIISPVFAQLAVYCPRLWYTMLHMCNEYLARCRSDYCCQGKIVLVSST